MDSRTLLDRALFQLTPTRTRFELMLFAKGKKEKFASGLFDPFASHLKVARDEISKGGYSISLQPPPSRDASWFTKATFERFVRFVSTPAVLERFVNLEAEINQIERSIQQDTSGISLVGSCDVRKSSESSKLKGEHEGKDTDTSVEENSKIRLQRLLESRKKLLRKEQAMAYARGLVAGFDKENMDDLIFFADAFGASRLREACTNFKELCKKKHADVLWMEELAAVEACSPLELSLAASDIILSNDSSISMMGASKSQATTNSDSTKDNGLPASEQAQPASANHQVPMHWQNHLPQYMYNFQGPIPQFPVYQGYPLPPVQPGSLNYPGNMQRYYNRSQKKSSRTKEKLNTSEADSGESTETESSISDSERNSDSQAHQLDEGSENRKKHRKKSSRTIVIRNINYITPNKRNKEKGQAYTESSDEDDPADKDSLKRDIDGAVGLLETSENLHDDRDSTTSRQGRASDAWGAFQDLLMKNENSSEVKTLEPMDVVRTSHGEFPNTPGTVDVDLESEKYYAKRKVSSDSFIATQRIGESETSGAAINFINGENGNSVLKRRDSGADDFLIPNRIEEQGINPNDIISTIGEKPSIIRSTEDEEWLIVGQSVEPGNRNAMTEQNIFGGDPVMPVDSSDIYEKGSHRERLIDDSFMVASRPEADDQYDSHWKTDISIVGDILMACKAENGTADVESKRKEPNTHEPDDLCMVFERDSDFDSMNNSWSMEYGIDLSLTEAATRCIGTESDKSANLKLSSETELKGNGDSKVKVPGKETKSKVSPGSLRKSRAEIVPKNKKPSFVNRTIVHKSKFEQEEEMRKRMEELAIQRQKRIAERTAASANASPASRKTTSESKASRNSMTNRNLVNRVNPVKLSVS